MRRRVLLALALALLALPAAAQSADAPAWRATISIGVAPQDGAVTLHVQLVGRGLPSEPIPLAILPARATNLSGAERAPEGRIVARGPLVAIAYDVPAPEGPFLLVALDALIARPSEPAHAGPERVGVVPQDGAEKAWPAGRAGLDVVAPEGWDAAVSAGAGGTLVAGEGLLVEQLDETGLGVRHASVGGPSPQEIALLARGLGYLGAQSRPLDDLLVVRAPSGALREEVVGAGIVALDEELPVETLARLLARAHQSYQVVEVAPVSAAWLREGEERYHAQLALLAAGLVDTQDVDAALAQARDESLLGTLPRAPEGSALARQKGLVVVRALDAQMRQASGERAGLADLVAQLAATDAERHDSASVQDAAQRAADASLAAFFDAYVYGTEWPPPRPVTAAGDVVVEAFVLDPPRAAPGEVVLARWRAVNRGTLPAEIVLPLRMDGAEVASVPLQLAVGERVEGALPLSSTMYGARTVALGPRLATLTILAPAQLSLARISVTPHTPRTDEAIQLLVYVENAGESPGLAHVEVREGATLLQRTTETSVEGESTRALTLALQFEVPGVHVLDVRLVGPDGEDAIAHELVVQYAQPPREVAGGGSTAGVAFLLAALGRSAVFLRAATGGAPGRRRR